MLKRYHSRLSTALIMHLKQVLIALEDNEIDKIYNISICNKIYSIIRTTIYADRRVCRMYVRIERDLIMNFFNNFRNYGK